jgi:hypothetical protein
MGVTSIIGTHTTLDSLGSFEATLLGDLLWKWQFIMSLSSFQNVFKPRAYLVLLLCNAKWSDTLPSPGVNPLEGLPKCSCGKLGLGRRSQLPTLERGRGSSWEPRD